jgi:hypothetical protein
MYFTLLELSIKDPLKLLSAYHTTGVLAREKHVFEKDEYTLDDTTDPPSSLGNTVVIEKVVPPASLLVSLLVP